MNRDVRLVALALFVWGLGEGLFLHIQPLHMEQLGATSVQVGGALAVASIGRAVVFLPAGLLADRLPRKPLILGAWLLGPLGALLMGVASSWQGLVPGLVLYGLSAYCIPVINAYVAHASAGASVERTFTTVYAIHTVGGIISPSLGGWLAQVAGFSATYLVAAGLFVLSATAAICLAPQPLPSRRSAAGAWQPLLDRRYVAFAAVLLLIFCAMYVGFPLAPNYLSSVRGWDVTQIGMLGSLQALGMSLFGWTLGRVGSLGRRAWGLVLGQVLVWLSALLLVSARAFPIIALAFLLRGAYQGCRSLAQARASMMAEEGSRGPLLGVAETVVASAQIAAPYLAGWLYLAYPALPLLASLALIPIAISLALWALPGH